MHPIISTLHVASLSSVPSSEGSSPPVATTLQERTTQVAAALPAAPAPTSAPAALATKTVIDTSSSSSSSASVVGSSPSSSLASSSSVPSLATLISMRVTFALESIRVAIMPSCTDTPRVPSLILDYCGRDEIDYYAKRDFIYPQLKTEEAMHASMWEKAEQEAQRMYKLRHASTSATPETVRSTIEPLKKHIMKEMGTSWVELSQEDFRYRNYHYEVDNLPLALKIQIQQIDELCISNPHYGMPGRFQPLITPTIYRTVYEIRDRLDKTPSTDTPLQRREKEVAEIHSLFLKVSTLDFSNRGLTSLPPCMHLFPNLRNLYLIGNPLTSPPDLSGFKHPVKVELE